MNIKEVSISGGSHVVILGAGASIAFSLHDGEAKGMALPSMNNLFNLEGISQIISSFPQSLITSNFEETYSNISEAYPDDYRLSDINSIIYEYFCKMKLPNKPTLYDQLIMSLTGKDLIATFNWDPFLFQASQRNYNHGSNPIIVYLHGNVAVGYNKKNNMIGPAGLRSPRTNNYYRHSQLLYPIKNKDYTKDWFISQQWKTLKDFLAGDNITMVTVFGYSAPVTDKAALQMMQDAWGDINKRNVEQFEIIDIRDENEVIASWKEFIHPNHYDYCSSFYDSILAKCPRRTSEMFYCRYIPATEEDSFVEENPMPERFDSFEDMWNWFQPLIDKEDLYTL